mgnify:FL=1
MPSKAYTSAGTILSVSSNLPDILSVDGFDIIVFDDIGEVSDIGDFGTSSDVLTYYEVGSSEPKKILGNKSFGSLTIRMAAIRSDTGQAIIQQARKDQTELSFKVTVPEPDIYYFTGLVTDYQVSVGGPDQIVSASITVSLSSEFIVEEDALGI